MSDQRKPVLIVGSITMDLVARAPQIPRVGQTVIGTGFDTTPGGKGANQAVAAAKLGYPVQMVGMVGDDVYGPTLKDNLAAMGVDTAGISTTGGPSGLAPIFLDERGQNSIIVVPGANGKMDRGTIDRHMDLIRGAGMVLCQLELPMDTINYTLAACAVANVPVMLDPAPAAPLEETVWDKLAWFTPNETEAAHYLPDGLTVEAGAAQLLSRGVRGVVLKRGAEGSYVTTADGRSGWVAPFVVDVVDTVGAGDCFNGAFAVGLLEGMDPLAAARFASAAAAISVTRSGAQGGMPSRAAVDILLAQTR